MDEPLAERGRIDPAGHLRTENRAGGEQQHDARKTNLGGQRLGHGPGREGDGEGERGRLQIHFDPRERERRRPRCDGVGDVRDGIEGRAADAEAL